jgi:hypothetical protein
VWRTLCLYAWGSPPCLWYLGVLACGGWTSPLSGVGLGVDTHAQARFFPRTLGLGVVNRDIPPHVWGPEGSWTHTRAHPVDMVRHKNHNLTFATYLFVYTLFLCLCVSVSERLGVHNFACRSAPYSVTGVYEITTLRSVPSHESVLSHGSASWPRILSANSLDGIFCIMG